MIIQAIKQPRTDMAGYHIAFQSATWCCEQMGEAWRTLEMTFGNEMFDTINGYAGVRWNQVAGHPLGQVGHKISHCPYCNAEIKVIVQPQLAA